MDARSRRLHSVGRGGLVRHLRRRQGLARKDRRFKGCHVTEPAHALPIAPADIHNQALLANVHPPDWVNPRPAPRYNMVVIGAGTAGLIIAAGAAGLGAKVALIERELMGGDCLNVGCVPSKALLRSARALADARDASAYGLAVAGGAGADFPAVMERMRRLRA